MQSLETQVAKIELGNVKEATSFAFVVAEQAPNKHAELYLVLELPLFNPAASLDCERIAKTIAATMRRCYRSISTDTTFEDMLASINEELGKLATLGENYWIGKLNAAICVKEDNRINLSTSGKITVLLMRDGQFTSLSDSSKNTNPLKTFDNFAMGKIKLEDFLIISTNQLFNFLSIDRMKSTLIEKALPNAAKEIIEHLESTAGPDTAFATLITLQVEPGTTIEDHINLETYTPPPHPLIGFFKQLPNKIFSAISYIVSITIKLVAQIFTKISKKESDTPPFNSTPEVIEKTQFIGTLKNSLHGLSWNFSLPKFSELSRAKKFFLGSITFLLIAFSINIFIARNVKKQELEKQTFLENQSKIEQLINNAEAASLYEDPKQTVDLLKQASVQINELKQKNPNYQIEITPLEQKLSELIQKSQKEITVETKKIASLSQGNFLINIDGFLATQNQTGNISAYKKLTGTVEENTLLLIEPAQDVASVNQGKSVVYSQSGLRIWNFISNNLHAPYTENVPKDNQNIGLAYYANNNRVYLIDRAKKSIISYAVNDLDFSKPIVSVSNIAGLDNASDLAVDGSIYLFMPGEIIKFQSGKPALINKPSLIEPLGNTGKLFTDIKTQNLYLLDQKNNRVVILNKNGDLQKILKNELIDNPIDFAVEEQTKTIYILNGTDLLELKF
jgi:hypothetical protein